MEQAQSSLEKGGQGRKVEKKGGRERREKRERDR